MSGNGKQRSDLITDLVSDLEPVRNPGKTLVRSLLWLLVAFAASIIFMVLRAPFRPGFSQQLLSVPQFATETILGCIAIIAVGVVAYRSAIPSNQGLWNLFRLPLGITVVWVSFYVYGLSEPALEPSMAGKRDHCYLEVFLYGLPALLAGIVALRALYPLRGTASGAMIGLAAGAIPALLMQLACMYVVPHMLMFHILPGLALAGFGGIVGYFFLRSN